MAEDGGLLSNYVSEETAARIFLTYFNSSTTISATSALFLIVAISAVLLLGILLIYGFLSSSIKRG